MLACKLWKSFLHFNYFPDTERGLLKSLRAVFARDTGTAFARDTREARDWKAGKACDILGWTIFVECWLFTHCMCVSWMINQATHSAGNTPIETQYSAAYVVNVCSVRSLPDVLIFRVFLRGINIRKLLLVVKIRRQILTNITSALIDKHLDSAFATDICLLSWQQIYKQINQSIWFLQILFFFSKHNAGARATAILFSVLKQWEAICGF